MVGRSIGTPIKTREFHTDFRGKKVNPSPRVEIGRQKALTARSLNGLYGHYYTEL
jgi:hypothetical protein